MSAEASFYSSGAAQGAPIEVDHAILALSRYRRRRFDDCIESCNALLFKNDQDQVRAVHYFNTSTLTYYALLGCLVYEMQSAHRKTLH